MTWHYMTYGICHNYRKGTYSVLFEPNCILEWPIIMIKNSFDAHCGSGLEVIKLFSCSTQLSIKFQLLIKAKMLKKKKFMVSNS